MRQRGQYTQFAIDAFRVDARGVDRVLQEELVEHACYLWPFTGRWSRRRIDQQAEYLTRNIELRFEKEHGGPISNDLREAVWHLVTAMQRWCGTHADHSSLFKAHEELRG